MALITSKPVVVSGIKKTIITIGDSFTFGHGCSDKIWYYDPQTKQHIGNSSCLATGPSQHCWSSLISKHYPDTQVFNLSGPGKDNISCVADMLISLNDDYQNLKIDAIIYAMTFDDRQQVCQPRGFLPTNFEERTRGRSIDCFKDYNPIISWSPMWSFDTWTFDKNLPDAFLKACIYYKEHLYSPVWGAKLSHTSLYSAYGIARNLNSKFFWSAPKSVSVQDNNYISESMRKLQHPNIIDYLQLRDPKGEPWRAADGHANDAGHKRYFLEVIKPIIDRELK